MDVFELRDRVIADYSSYVRSFLTIKDHDIATVVWDSIDQGLLWPDPLIQLNPAFAAGDSLHQLVKEDVLHPECMNVFRDKREDGTIGAPLRLHRHQVERIRAARAGDSYVLTTGTGVLPRVRPGILGSAPLAWGGKATVYLPRELSDRLDNDDGEPGLLHVSASAPRVDFEGRAVNPVAVRQGAPCEQGFSTSCFDARVVVRMRRRRRPAGDGRGAAEGPAACRGPDTLSGDST
jgi:hypothetical protein